MHINVIWEGGQYSDGDHHSDRSCMYQKGNRKVSQFFQLFLDHTYSMGKSVIYQERGDLGVHL